METKPAGKMSLSKPQTNKRNIWTHLTKRCVDIINIQRGLKIYKNRAKTWADDRNTVNQTKCVNCWYACEKHLTFQII